MQVVFLFLISALVNNLIFMKLQTLKVKLNLPLLINSIRLLYSSFASIFLLLQKPTTTFVLFVLGCGTYTVNFPVERMRIKFNKTNKIDISLIADQFFVIPFFTALVFISDKSYNYFVNYFKQNAPQMIINLFNLKSQQIYQKTITTFNTPIVYVYSIMEFFLSMYPFLKSNRKSVISQYTKSFTTLLALFYSLASSCKYDYGFTPLFYRQASKQFIINIPDYLLLNSVFFNVTFFFFQLIPKHYYANALSLINLFFGILALIYIYVKQHTEQILIKVPFFVLLGQFADLFDGRAAERFGSTPHGEFFDDAADFASFGLATGFYVYKVLYIDFGFNFTVSLAIGLFYVICVAYRLIRFIVNKKKAGVKTGVRFFEGLPSPAGSAMVITVSAITEIYLEKLSKNMIFKTAYVFYILAISGVMVTYIKYPHFGRVFVNSRKISNKLKGAICTYFFLCVWKGIYDKQYMPALSMSIVFQTGYLILPLFNMEWLYETPLKRNEESSEDSQIKEYQIERNTE